MIRSFVSVVLSDISVRHEIHGVKRIEIMSKEVHSAIHQFVERRLTIEASILNTGRLNMTSNFDNIIIIVGK